MKREIHGSKEIRHKRNEARQRPYPDKKSVLEQRRSEARREYLARQENARINYKKFQKSIEREIEINNDPFGSISGKTFDMLLNEICQERMERDIMRSDNPFGKTLETPSEEIIAFYKKSFPIDASNSISISHASQDIQFAYSEVSNRLYSYSEKVSLEPNISDKEPRAEVNVSQVTDSNEITNLKVLAQSFRKVWKGEIQGAEKTEVLGDIDKYLVDNKLDNDAYANFFNHLQAELPEFEDKNIRTTILARVRKSLQ
jgi:hypothetical protein